MPARITPQENEALIRRIAREYGVDPNLAVAIARQESGLDHTAVGDGGHSVGTFQLHDQGMGAGMGQARYDPETNARTALQSLARTAAARPDLASNPGALAAASQRPADPAGYARSINAMLGGQPGVPHAGSPLLPGNAAHAPPGGLSVADTAKVAELTSQRNEIQQRLETNKRLQKNLPLAQEYADATDVKTPAWLRAHGMTQAQLDVVLEAKGLNAKDLAAAVAKDEEALRKVGLDLATEKGAEGTLKEVDGRLYLVSPDGTSTPVTGIPEKTKDGTWVQAGNRSVLVAADGTVLQSIEHTQAPRQPKEPLAPQFVPGGPGQGAFFDPTTGVQVGPGVDVRTELQKEIERLSAEQERFKAAREVLVNQQMQGFAAGELTTEEVQTNIALFDRLHKTRLEAQQEETNTRLQETLALAQREFEETKRANAERERQAAEAARVAEQRAAETAAATERERLAGGMRAIGTLEAQRQSAFSGALGQFEQSGVATPGRIAGLEAMRQPLSAQMYAGMLGLSPDDPRAVKLAEYATRFFGPGAGTAGTAGTPGLAAGPPGVSAVVAPPAANGALAPLPGLVPVPEAFSAASGAPLPLPTSDEQDAARQYAGGAMPPAYSAV